MRAIALLLLAACASSPRANVPEAPPAIPEARVIPAPAVNPVGEFEWSSALGDGTPIKESRADQGAVRVDRRSNHAHKSLIDGKGDGEWGRVS